MTELTTREDDGTFKKGVSGNPNGRPKGKKNELTELKQDLELAIRRSLPVSRITKIVEQVATMAEQGNLRAAKLILDKVISNASSDTDDAEKSTGGIVIRIENATAFAEAQRERNTPPPAIEAEYTEVKKE
jgi:hypothetical protein